MEWPPDAFGQVPFAGMADRTWAIDGTLDIALPDLLINADRDRNLIPTDGYSGVFTSYYVDKHVRLKNASMFASVGADDMREGPSSIVIRSRDYRGVLSGKCAERFKDSFFRFQCTADLAYQNYIDYALECPIKPLSWVIEAFPNAVRAATAKPLTVQCPAFPWQRGSWNPGVSNSLPSDSWCGLSTEESIRFPGPTGTDATCCFNQVYLSGNIYRCEDSEQRRVPSCNRYECEGYEWCQDMRECVGDGRLEWPFLLGAWLSTNGDDQCFKLPPALGDTPRVLRLPALDIRTIPRVTSPFTNQTYCSVDRYKGTEGIWGVGSRELETE